jgi:hypothetical protein
LAEANAKATASKIITSDSNNTYLIENLKNATIGEESVASSGIFPTSSDDKHSENWSHSDGKDSEQTSTTGNSTTGSSTVMDNATVSVSAMSDYDAEYEDEKADEFLCSICG